MYPQRELIRLAAHKAELRRTIAAHRADCITASAGITRPLAWLDHALVLWRKISPLILLAAPPLGFLAARTFFPRLKVVRPLLRWGPLVFSAIRGIGAVFTAPARSARS